MSTTLTPNLKLRVADTLTADAVYNLSLIDQLASTFIVDTSNTLNLRSKSDISIEPNSADIGGSGSGGSLSIGNSNHSLSSISAYTLAFNLTSPLSLLDQASGGTKYLNLTYKSGIQGGGTDTSANRNLYVDPSSGDRNLVLTGDLKLLGGFNLSFTTSGSSSLVLPTSGTLATLAGIESLSHKSLVAPNLDSAVCTTYLRLGSAAQLRLGNAGDTQYVGFQAGSLSSNTIWTLPTSDGVNHQVLATDGSGNLSWYTTPGTGTVLSVGLTAPSNLFSVSGSPVTLSGTLSLSYQSQTANQVFCSPDAGSGTPGFRTLVNSDISSSAAIARTKIASGTSNQVLINDNSGVLSGLTLTSGQLVVGSTGVAPVATSLTGTSNQVVVTNGAGSITLSTPQNIHTSATPTFSSETLSSNTNQLVLGTTNTTTLTMSSLSSSRVFTLPDADSNSVRPSSASSHQFATGVASTGVISYAQPTVSDLAALTAKGVVSTDSSGILTSTALTNGQLLIGSTGAVPVAASLTGTSNQVSVATGAGSITLSTPQNIHSAATPTFSSLTLSASSGNLVLGTTNTLTLQIPSLSSSYSLTLPTSAGSANQVLTTNGSGVTSWTSGAVANSYTATWTDTDGSTKAISHNLGTRDVMVQVYDNNSPYDQLFTENMKRTDTNTVTLTITNTPASFSWRVLIFKLG